MTAEARDIVLEVEGLRSGYGPLPVLHGISLAVREDEAVGILGHNGMGKSTLLKTLMGLLPATAGVIRLDDTAITRLPPYERSRMGLGYVPQGRGIFPQLTVLENLRFAFTEQDGESEDDAIERVLADFPRIAQLLERRGGDLSGGEQQLLALARCLMARPWFLLLDEPTEGIQPSIIDEIAETLQRVKAEQGLTVLLVEQNLDFITRLSDRVLILERGVIAAEARGADAGNPAIVEEFAGLGGSRSGSKGYRRPVDAAPPSAAAAAQRPASNPPAPKPQPDTSRATAPKEAYMTVKRPTLDQMREIVQSLHMRMTDAEIAEYLASMEPTFQAYDRIDALPDHLPEVKYPRTPGYRPSSDENPLNAWYYKCEVKGAGDGPLAGKRIVLKDNVCLAGVPMMNGASTLEGYTPDVDATIVARILDAGGTIVGKAHCEYFCLSGGSHTNATGPIHNPYKMGYTAGGSSCGSGALVGSGEVGMAIGGDQGGSIRIPASYSGCYGMKPTHGLVPYTGVMPIEATIDHTGPITATVADNALLLQVLAGADGLDPRQYAPRVGDYQAALGQGVHGLRIGVVSEGFGLPASEPDVDAKVREAAERFREAGASVEEASAPMHGDGAAIWTSIALEGLTRQMMQGNGFGTNWEGLYVTSLLDAHANWRSRADELSKSLKFSMLVGEYFLDRYRGHFYAKAQNLSRKLKAHYNEVLDRFDLLLMPTTPMKATPLPPADAELGLVLQRAFEMVPNTAPFDASGHPAMSIPCGMSDGLPVGMMLIAKHYEEATIYRAAHAFEQLGDWRTM